MNVRLSILEAEDHQLHEVPGTSETGKKKTQQFWTWSRGKPKTFWVQTSRCSWEELTTSKRPKSSQEEISHSLKWTDSSKILSNFANQKFNTKKVLGF